MSKLLNLKNELQAGTIGIVAFNKGIKEAVAEHKSFLTDKEKAAIFDKLIDYETNVLTEQEETWADHGTVPIIYRDSEYNDYSWEHLETTLFGDDFFDFHNNLYEGS